MTDSSSVSQQIDELVALADNLFATGKIDEALNIYSALNQVTPNSFRILKPLGIIAATKGAYSPAIALLNEASALRSDDALVHNVLSVCHFQIGNHLAALESADAALTHKRKFPEAHNNRGNALHRLGQNKAAITSFKEALRLGGDDPEVLINLANALHATGQLPRALQTVNRAIGLNPGISAAHRNRGNILHDLDRDEEALKSYDRAIELNPRMTDAYSAKGNILKYLGKLEEAIHNYDKALVLDNNLEMIHFNRSHCHLLLGHFELGWHEYERRWSENTPGLASRRHFPMPLWLGDAPLQGKTILLHCEQGLGDSIQFVRYASSVVALGANVYLEAYEPLIRLFREVPGLAGVVSRETPVVADFHCPLMSLPLAFINIGTKPRTAPPYLAAPLEAAAQWSHRLCADGGLKVGVVCSGNPANTNDSQRSIPLGMMLPRLPAGPSYFLIQTDLREADRMALSSRPDFTFLGTEITDFTDTAAICQAMDLVIGVDTSVTHLAGALAKPTWALLPYEPDWRWRLEAKDTPWYPSVDLYCQTSRGDWQGVLTKVESDLAAIRGRP